jgi:hypothetical protein
MGTDAREPLLDPGEDPRVGDALASIAQALSVPPDEVTARRHRNAIVRARQLQPVVLARRSAATGIAAAVLVGALAVGGALPSSVQDTVADLASRVGIDLPRSTTDSEVPPPVPAGRDDEATDADTSVDDDRADERGDRGDRGSTSRDGDGDAVPATESTRPGPADEVPDEADRSEAPTTPSEADDRVPSDPPADAPGSGAGSTPAPAPTPTPTPSDPPVSRPSPPAPPAPDDPPSGQGDAAPPRPDEDVRDDPREDGRAAGDDGARPAPDHPA